MSARLEDVVAQHVSAIHRTASASPAGGGPEWDALLRHHGLAPLDAAERSFIRQQMRLARGAVPAEVRAAFLGLQAWATEELGRRQASGAVLSPGFSWHVAALTDRETAAYERSLLAEGSVGFVPAAPAPVAPPAPAGPSLASIFANARQTSKEVPWANVKHESVASLVCVHCGGPQERPQDFMCKYCRRPIAGTSEPTA